MLKNEEAKLAKMGPIPMPNVGMKGPAIQHQQKRVMEIEDAIAAKSTITDLQAATVKSIRAAVFTIAYRVWEGS